MSSEHIIKRHNKNLMLYHLVCPVKFRRTVFTGDVEKSLKDICIEIGKQYEIHFVEIGSDEDHVHFLTQSVPMMAPARMVTIIKSITARFLFKSHPGIQEIVWGRHLWSSGYYINTVGQYANEQVIKNYVKNQGKNYKQFYRDQLTLFEGLTYS